MKTFGLEEAAEFLRISKDSMRKMADSGKVPGAKVGPESGRVWIFTDESLEDYLREEIRRQTAVKRGNAEDGLRVSMQATFSTAPSEQGRKPTRRRPRTPPVLSAV